MKGNNIGTSTWAWEESGITSSLLLHPFWDIATQLIILKPLARSNNENTIQNFQRCMKTAKADSSNKQDCTEKLTLQWKHNLFETEKETEFLN